eukprot:944803-Prorocentrum_minimum.AAC.1
MGRVFAGWKPPPATYRCSLPAASQPVSQSASQPVSQSASQSQTKGGYNTNRIKKATREGTCESRCTVRKGGTWFASLHRHIQMGGVSSTARGSVFTGGGGPFTGGGGPFTAGGGPFTGGGGPFTGGG